MTATPIFTHELSFSPEAAAQVLRTLPAGAGIVALFGHAATDRPYVMQTANLRRRLQRLLMPAEGQTKRLNLRDRIARIAWRRTHSELESMLLLHDALSRLFGAEEARRKLRLSPPFTVRYAMENRFPRIYVTNHLRRRSLQTTVGPFASRLDAERYREAVEELFTIRRCFLELHPSPNDPGCIYGEMKKCMAPCQMRCTDEQYEVEAKRTLDFMVSRGTSLIAELERERERASEAMLFEEAAAAHARVARARSVATDADRLVGRLDELRAALLVPCKTAHADAEPRVQVFLFAAGRLRGPGVVSLLGVRVAKEQTEVGSSLFAQPMMLAAVPLPGADSLVAPERAGSHSLESSAEERLLAAIARLEDGPEAASMAELGDHLAMLRRWYYRPEKQREGLLFQLENGSWPARKMVRAAGKLLTARSANHGDTPGNAEVVSPTPTAQE